MLENLNYCRNKLKVRPQRSIKFGGKGFVKIDRSSFADMDDEFDIRLKFKTSNPNGILLLLGRPEEGSFVSVDLQNGYLVYR